MWRWPTDVCAALMGRFRFSTPVIKVMAIPYYFNDLSHPAHPVH